MDAKASVLILDDDPSHLRIYGWIVEAAGYGASTSLVRSSGFDLPNTPPDLVLLDYHLAGKLTAVDAAQEIRRRMPNIPIVVLSDALVLPDDVAPLVNGFVRKGDPGKLVYTLQQTLRR